jgi:hypothetical protein
LVSPRIDFPVITDPAEEADVVGDLTGVTLPVVERAVGVVLVDIADGLVLIAIVAGNVS